MDAPKKKTSRRLGERAESPPQKSDGSGPRDLQDEIEKVIRQGKEVANYVDDRTESIRKGARRAKKRFRI